MKTALISAAGYGSRFFPISKSLQKEMLPVLNRPVLDYLVDDCIAAGISHIILILREGQDLVRHYYTEQPGLRAFFEHMGTAKKYEAIENLHHKATFTFIVQKDSDLYGTAVPVKLAAEYLKDEPAFLYLTGDDFVYHPDGSPEAGDLMATWEATQAAAVISAREVEAAQISRYGIIETEERDGYRYMRSMIEKPALGSTTSRLANISKYVLTPSIFPLLAEQAVNATAGELYITDTLSTLQKTQPIAIHVPKGDYLDCGTVASWLKANLRVAKQDAALWDEIRTELI